MKIYQVVAADRSATGSAYYDGEFEGVHFKAYLRGTTEEVSEALARARGFKNRYEDREGR